MHMLAIIDWWWYLALAGVLHATWLGSFTLIRMFTVVSQIAGEYICELRSCSQIGDELSSTLLVLVTHTKQFFPLHAVYL